MSSVYLLRNEEHGVYKIGKSNKPKIRLNQLRTGNHSEIILFDTYESEYANEIEKTLHRRYNPYNIQLEWFELDLIEAMEFKSICKKIEDQLKFLTEQNNPFIKRKH